MKSALPDGRKLVRLDTLPQNDWLGQKVYHPMAQEGDDTCYWTLESLVERWPDMYDDDDAKNGWSWDEGIVIEVRPDRAFSDMLQVRFQNANTGGTLIYNPTNLWVRDDER